MLTAACAAQKNSLPGLFALDSPDLAIWPSVATLLQRVAVIGGGQVNGFTLADADAAFADPDAIGWAYQFYQEEEKAAVYAKLAAGGKIATREDIAAATQLFTEPYMVQWLLQNSLGRSYHECYPESALPASWTFYVSPDRFDRPAVHNLSELTVLDPCMGSGHFLREAFDMLVTMYREREPALSARAIADRILTQHLYGIDIDPRAAQLAALTLYLRAWELVRDDHRRQGQRGQPAYQPPAMHLATTPDHLGALALQQHMERHPEDRVLQDLLSELFKALEHADLVGSLLEPERSIQRSIDQLRQTHTQRLESDPAASTLRSAITQQAKADLAQAASQLLEQVASIFAGEAASSGEVAAQLFGERVAQGMSLLRVLQRRYAVVVTNPPYAGSKNLDRPLRRHIEQYYPKGKRDLYAAFIQRCLTLAQDGGRIGMVTQQSWMFLRSFAELRKDLLERQTIDCLAHLGEHGFEDSSAAGAFAVLFVLTRAVPAPEHRIWAARLVGPTSPAEKEKLLRQAIAATRTQPGPQLVLSDAGEERHESGTAPASIERGRG